MSWNQGRVSLTSRGEIHLLELTDMDLLPLPPAPPVLRSDQWKQEVGALHRRTEQDPRDVGAWANLVRDYCLGGMDVTAVETLEHARRAAGGLDLVADAVVDAMSPQPELLLGLLRACRLQGGYEAVLELGSRFRDRAEAAPLQGLVEEVVDQARRELARREQVAVAPRGWRTRSGWARAAVLALLLVGVVVYAILGFRLQKAELAFETARSAQSGLPLEDLELVIGLTRDFPRWHPDRGRAAQLLGHASLLLGQDESSTPRLVQAREAFLEASRRQPGNLEVQLLLGRTCRLLGQRAAAEAALRAAAQSRVDAVAAQAREELRLLPGGVAP